LGEFVERLTGIAFTSYVDAHVLKPLGITPSELGYSILNSPDHACGYLKEYSLLNAFKRLLIDRQFIGAYYDGWLEIYPHYLNGAAFGGLVGTARGFVRFLQDQLHPHSVLFSDMTRSQFYARQQTNDGSKVPSSLGWQIETRNGSAYYYKEGGGGGFHCLMRMYPAFEIGTVVMINATRFNVRGLLDTLDPAFLGGHRSK